MQFCQVSSCYSVLHVRVHHFHIVKVLHKESYEGFDFIGELSRRCHGKGLLEAPQGCHSWSIACWLGVSLVTMEHIHKAIQQKLGHLETHSIRPNLRITGLLTYENTARRAESGE